MSVRFDYGGGNFAVHLGHILAEYICSHVCCQINISTLIMIQTLFGLNWVMNEA